MKRKKIIALAVITLTVLLSGFLGHNLAANQAVPRISYVPAETGDVLSNPYMGFAVDAKNLKAKQPFRLAHANLRWRELEPEKGVYAFDVIEKRINLEHWRKNGVKLVLRVILDYPGEQAHMDIPDWLYAEINGQGKHYDIEYGKGFSPDYNNPVLIANHKRLIEALGKRYDHDPAIAFIQLGSVGHWGEWHTMDDGNDKIPFPARSVTDQYAGPYVQAFPHKLLLMRRPHHIALKNGMGLFNDAFGKTEETVSGFMKWYTKGYTSWLTGEEEPAMPDFWAAAPSGGEFAPDGKKYLDDERIDETIRQAKLTHVTWMGPNAPYEEAAGGPMQRNIDRFLKTIGYRFVIAKESHEKTAAAGGRLAVRLNIINRGVAPFYYSWPLELSLADRNGKTIAAVKTGEDIRKWLPGETQVDAELAVPKELAPGVYTIQAAILDPETGLPGVEFAIEGKSEDGRYALGKVTIQTEN